MIFYSFLYYMKCNKWQLFFSTRKYLHRAKLLNNETWFKGYLLVDSNCWAAPLHSGLHSTTEVPLEVETGDRRLFQKTKKNLNLFYIFMKWEKIWHFYRNTKLNLTNERWSSLQWNSVITNSVVNEHSVTTNRFLIKISHFTSKIYPVITNPSYNEQKWPVPSCSL